MNVLKKIADNPEKLIFGLEKSGFLDWMKEETYIRLTYRLAFGRKLNLDNPKAFTEKINWYKLNYRDPLMRKCADKYEVRSYVEKQVGKKYLNDIIGIWNNVEEIDFDSLPNKFVLKPTNGSGDVVICKDKTQMDWDAAKKTLSTYSKRHFSTKTKEWAYYNLPYRILGERLIESSDANQIKDYKLFCFNDLTNKNTNGCKFLFVASERGTESLKFDFFDTKWNWLPVTNAHEHNKNLERPKHLEEMIEVAEKLAKPFPHVRVDLYEEEGKVYFGELTFYHFGGFTRFEPDEWDFKFGDFFTLPTKRKER